MGFDNGLKKVHAWFIENWADIELSFERNESSNLISLSRRVKENADGKLSKNKERI